MTRWKRPAGCLLVLLIAGLLTAMPGDGSALADDDAIENRISEEIDEAADWVRRLFRGLEDDRTDPTELDRGETGDGAGGGFQGGGPGGGDDDGGGDDGGDDGGGDDGGDD